MFVRRVVFVRPNDWLDDEDECSSSSRPVATLSIPMVNNVIESSVIIIVFTGRIGYSIAIIHIDNVSDIIPLPICKKRNHAGSSGRLLLVTTGVMKLSIHSNVEILFVAIKPWSRDSDGIQVQEASHGLLIWCNTSGKKMGIIIIYHKIIMALIN